MSTVRTQGGSGLGLFLCKSIIEAHSGEIEAESELGKGSAFSIPISDTMDDR